MSQKKSNVIIAYSGAQLCVNDILPSHNKGDIEY